MDFGAMICKPKSPLCQACVQSKKCYAYQYNRIGELPVKKKKIEKRVRWFYYFIIENGNNIYIRQRTEKDIWQNLYEFVLWETAEALVQPEKQVAEYLHKVLGKKKFIVTKVSKMYKQQLTHQTIQGIFLTIRLSGEVSGLKEYELIKKKKLKNYHYYNYFC